ncbi:DUF5681 domain-containing protein [Methyloglobulus sp.]|uniref:DUF5681 domain-containing protein n=1 Tax=Methyloglobulus sp. TaxID=2518622 RepID=UPI0039899371
MSKFKEGESGNPKGRPPGLSTANKIRQEIHKALPSILETVVKAAQSGDMAACKLILDRVCPTLKPIAQNINLPLPVNGELHGMGSEILKATMGGNISPDVGSMLITAMANQAKLVEIDDLAKRIEALETRNEHQNQTEQT